VTDTEPERPRVGLSTYRADAAWGVWHQSADLLPTTYADAVVEVGGVPLLLPPAAVTDAGGAAGTVLTALDGLVLAGGSDIDPERYGADRDPQCHPPHPDRDAWELALVRAALNRDLPILAICRGVQVLNVALGGDIVQHLPDVVGHHGHSPVKGQMARHDVRTADGSKLAGLLGQRATVATYHHQAVGRLGESLTPTAWADDGTVEALEHDHAPWVVGVQWHPEVHDGTALFAGFVAACAARRLAPAAR
jgi:gamma-glutamyl-gamma-aminobutyrate hydrolase PuuD